MPTYNPPLRDMQFVMHELLNVTADLKTIPRHADIDVGTINAILEEGGKFASEVIFPLNISGDEEGCTYDKVTHAVTTPSGFKEAYGKYVEGGWAALSGDPEYGGQGLPLVVNQCFYEMMNSANQAWTMYPGLTHGAHAALHTHGTDEQKKTYLNKMTSGEWTGTMCLTEPHCGTDLGMLRTKAIPCEDGQALAAVGRVAAQRGPTAFHKLRVGLLEALGRRYLMADLVKLATLFVAADIERKGDFCSEFSAFFEHGVDGVSVDVGMPGQELQLVGDLEHFVQNELHVAQRGVVLRHVGPLALKRMGRGEFRRNLFRRNSTGRRCRSGRRIDRRCHLSGAIARQNVGKAGVGAVQGTGRFKKAGFVIQAKDEAMNLEGHLLLVGIGAQVAGLLGLHQRAVHRGQPGSYRARQRVAHRTGPVVKLNRAADVEAARIDFNRGAHHPVLKHGA